MVIMTSSEKYMDTNRAYKDVDKSHAWLTKEIKHFCHFTVNLFLQKKLLGIQV